MSFLRIKDVHPLQGFEVRVRLTDETSRTVNLEPLLKGPMFEEIRNDRRRFVEVSVESGTLVWPNGADLCPDVLIWGGPPPAEDRAGSHAGVTPAQ